MPDEYTIKVDWLRKKADVYHNGEWFAGVQGGKVESVIPFILPYVAKILEEGLWLHKRLGKAKRKEV